ncbi:DUF6132 family protein [Membranihabitans marinus]|uniref:DUF6132 family protein n=1 Tax=Membranihabitans marinus TaxID=1227546 RepID=UPI001F2F3188|nr:DUF6132 family protein [Membranihabitans marinus]
MKQLIKQNILTIIGLSIGGIAGFLYWNYVGCTSNTCAITSHPLNSSLYGAVMGGLLLSMFKSEKSDKNSDNKE